MRRSGSLALALAFSSSFIKVAASNFIKAFMVALAAALVAMTGCASLQVKMGSKVYLDRLPVTAIQAALPDGPGIAPGQKSALVVRVTQPDGTVLQTEGKGEGKILWRDLAITASVVSANNKGILSLPADPRSSDGQLPHVTITVPSHPDLRAELDVPVRYDRKFTAEFRGFSGSSGMDGRDGSDGFSGSSGSLDPQNPSAGGNGSDGGNGTDGEDGKAGDNGPAVQVRVRLRPGDRPLLEVSVQAQRTEKFFLVDPKGGLLVVSSAGGSGGSGGRGGRAGRGGSGGIGSPNGQSGHDGLSGHDGFNGSPGKGGSITVTYDPQAKPFLGAIQLSNDGGPRPVLKEESVGPLW